MTFTIASWNINSLLPRLSVVTRLLREEHPDVLCLQKCRAAKSAVPLSVFEDLGYPHRAIRDQGEVNGVAIFSRTPIMETAEVDIAGQGEARYLFARLANGVGIHNMYVPAGGSTPDASTDPAFEKKRAFLADAGDRFRADRPTKAILVGDLNIAPEQDDVYDHALLKNEVTHSPAESAMLAEVRAAGDWVDVLRKVQPTGAMYSWWSYRWWNATVPVGHKNDKGRRIDHIWASPDLAVRLQSAWVDRAARNWKGTSDHAPVFARFDI